jgi:hypothetical protein
MTSSYARLRNRHAIVVESAEKGARIPATLRRPGKKLQRFLRVRDFHQAQPEKLKFGHQQSIYRSILPVCGELLILGEISNSPHTASGLLTSCCANSRTSSFMAGSAEKSKGKFLTSRHERA